jgi:hypothetical protein
LLSANGALSIRAVGVHRVRASDLGDGRNDLFTEPYSVADVVRAAWLMTTKSIAAIAVEIEQPKGLGRIRLQSVPDFSRGSLIGFIEAAVEPGAGACTALPVCGAGCSAPTRAGSARAPRCLPQ